MPIPTRWEVVPIRVQPSPVSAYGDAGLIIGEGWEPLPLHGAFLAPTVEVCAVGDGYLDPFRLRTEFFRLDVSDPKATLAFLNRVGLWELLPSFNPLAPAHLDPAHRPVIDVTAGFRRLNGAAVGTSPAVLRQAQLEWSEKLRLIDKPEELRKQFPPPPTSKEDKFGFALAAEDYNTMPFHVEWRRATAQGVIQPISLLEMLNCTHQLDLLRGMPPQVCQRHDCGVRFTGRERKYCSDSCARLEAMRSLRRRNKEKNKKKRGW